MRKERFAELVDQIHNKIPIEQVIETWTGSDPMNRRTFSCPFHTTDKPGSFYVAGNKFKCFVCDAGGDAIDFVSQYDGVTFRQAVYKIAVTFELMSQQEYEEEAKMKYVGERRKAETIDNSEKVEVADPEFLDFVYRQFSRGMNLVDSKYPRLNEQHTAYLLGRGISIEEQRFYGYFSIPDRRVLNALRISLEAHGYTMHDLIGVPGFYEYRETGNVDMVQPEGIGIPLRRPDGMISAIQVRHDFLKEGDPRYTVLSSSFTSGKSQSKLLWGGCGPADMISTVWPRRLEHSRTILITEGQFKAAKWCETFHTPAITVQGVNNIKGIDSVLEQLDEILKEKGYEGLQRIMIGFDADLKHNKNVFKAMLKLRKTIEDLGPECFYLGWDEELGKGIDDVIINGNVKKVRVYSVEKYEKMTFEELSDYIAENGDNHEKRWLKDFTKKGA